MHQNKGKHGVFELKGMNIFRNPLKLQIMKSVKYLQIEKFPES